VQHRESASGVAGPSLPCGLQQTGEDADVRVVRTHSRIAAAGLTLLVGCLPAIAQAQPSSAATANEHGRIEIRVPTSAEPGVGFGVFPTNSLGLVPIQTGYIPGGTSHLIVVPIDRKTERVWVAVKVGGPDGSPGVPHVTGHGYAFPDGLQWSDCLGLRPNHTVVLEYRRSFHIVPGVCR
jgi:hypothetical protein